MTSINENILKKSKNNKNLSFKFYSYSPEKLEKLDFFNDTNR